MKGTYLGTLSQVNHLDLVGWINTARYKWAEIMGKEIKFRPATFYLGIVDMLAREVEGQKDEEVEGAEGHEEQDEGQERREDVEIAARRSQEEEREQMIHSLEDAGAEVQAPASSLLKVKAAEESKSSSGSVTPRASLLNRHHRNTENSSGSLTPRPLSRVETSTSETHVQKKEPEGGGERGQESKS